MKKFFYAVFVLIMVLGFSARIMHKRKLAQDAYIRDRVLMLVNPEQGQCSAIEIKAPSGKVYTLSAAHCQVLIENGTITAIAENGAKKALKVVRIDEPHDLMILEAFDDKSINVAKSDRQYERVHTLTHGAGKPTYRTDGYFLDIEDIDVMDNHTPIEECKNVQIGLFGSVCVKKEHVRESTAQVVGGSSGGAVLNDAGELVGIVSCGDDHFSGFVTLQDIQADLKSL